MRNHHQFYINGQWVAPAGDSRLDVINPATEAVAGSIAMGAAADVERAVAAARAAFPAFSQSTREERLDLLARIGAAYKARFKDMAEAICEERVRPSRPSPVQGRRVPGWPISTWPPPH